MLLDFLIVPNLMTKPSKLLVEVQFRLDQCISNEISRPLVKSRDLGMTPDRDHLGNFKLTH
jgi:hypothetical protein